MAEDVLNSEAVRSGMRHNVKIIPIAKDLISQAVMPSAETVRNRLYPFSAPIFVHYDSKNTEVSLKQLVQPRSRRGAVKRYAESLK